MAENEFLNQLQKEYRQLELKYFQLWQGLDHRIFNLDGGWFNGEFERSEDGQWISQSYPIPVISVKGYCDVEIGFDKITVSAKRKRTDALMRSYENLLPYEFEAFGSDDCSKVFYRPGMTTEQMKAKIKESNEQDIRFRFILPWDTDQEQIYEFVKLLRWEEFYYK